MFVGKWGTKGDGHGQFDYLSGVAVASDDSVYVADIRNSRIQKFTAAGVFVNEWGTQGDGVCQFGYPQDLAVASTGSVYVADSANNRIQRLFPRP